MSKDNSNLRLLGSPVNLSYRDKKKLKNSNTRTRPRSALQNSCFTPDNQERYKRPFSADAKERAHSTRGFFNSIGSDFLQYNNSPVTTMKILPPTTELLGDTKDINQSTARDRDLCSNASDYGSEDTYISLGSKIKARAQGPKNKNIKPSNNLKYRNIRKPRKTMEESEEKDNEYGLEIKITERPPPSPVRERSLSPSFKTRAYESYFIPLESSKKVNAEALAGRVSFGSSNIDEEVEQAIDTYSRRLTLTKQQLSLVEEESTQDLESVHSQRMPSLSPENIAEDRKDNGNTDNDLTGRNTYVVDKDDYRKMSSNFMNESRTYNSFYNEFHTNSLETYKNKMSSTIAVTDSSSKDSGYHDNAPNEGRNSQQNCYSEALKKYKSLERIDQPKSLDSLTSKHDKYPKTFPPDKNCEFDEPLNHSRLLYKDFFLKKEGHVALPPQNSPTTSIGQNFPGTSEVDNAKTETNETPEYPEYLLNSTTKAYTSKVIEDYKKELQAINNLHELTLKDIKTDAVSPTPLNIDKMFEMHSSFDDKHESNDVSNNTPSNVDKNKNTLDMKRDNISKVSTKELIQNYLKVKEGDYIPDILTKTLKKFDRKVNNTPARVDSRLKKDWNNKPANTNLNNKYSAVNVRNQTQKNQFTLRAPMSARIDSVQHDKDVDSWISLAAPSPRVHEEPIHIQEEPSPPDDVRTNVQEPPKSEPAPPAETPPAPVEKDTEKSKELNSNSTVFDIYSMLKEIESYGEHPVTVVSNSDILNTSPVTQPGPNPEERSSTPKDNFMEIFEFLEKVEQSANDALSVVTTTIPQSVPKLEALLKLPQTELAQRLVTASLQLEERSCCIALLQESLANHKEQMVNKVSNLEKQSLRNISKVKQECEEAIKRHQTFIDQLISDKKTLNHRIEQLVDERRAIEERWRRAASAQDERYKLELRNQHDKMAAAQQVARQRWVRQKAEKIKELTVKGLEGELREMAERQQKEIADLKMYYAEQSGKMQAKHAAELEELRKSMEEEREGALVKERHLASSRLEKQILELEVSYQGQRGRLVSELRAECERLVKEGEDRENRARIEMEQWKMEQEQLLAEKKVQLEQHIAAERELLEQKTAQKHQELEQKFEQYKKDFEAEQQMALKKRVTEIAAQHKQERDREIEKAIESMEAEAQAGRKELQEALRRTKEQYESELSSLGETEAATLRRCQAALARLRAAEDACAEFEVKINQLETRNKVLTEKNINLDKQVEEIRARCDESWQMTVEDMKRAASDLKKTHEEQMHQLYAKVKVAVARKDSAIQALTREAAKYQEKIAVLEQKLQQQRKDFLKHK